MAEATGMACVCRLLPCVLVCVCVLRRPASLPTCAARVRVIEVVVAPRLLTDHHHLWGRGGCLGPDVGVNTDRGTHPLPDHTYHFHINVSPRRIQATLSGGRDLRYL